MKINYLKRYFIGIVMTAFLALLAGNAFANPAADKPASRGNVNTIDFANNYMVVSPYWQVQGEGVSYSFIAVSHSSLSGMASVIGVKMNAITSTGAAYDTAATFTVRAGNTQRVFIAPTNHATINATSIPTGVFMVGTTDFTYGHIRVNPVTSHPMLKKGGVYGANSTDATNNGSGFRDTTMLTYWGSVIIEANTTGFAMEFIGDMNDSQSMGINRGYNWGAGGIGGRGINKVYATGVNLQ